MPVLMDAGWAGVEPTREVVFALRLLALIRQGAGEWE